MTVMVNNYNVLVLNVLLNEQIQVGAVFSFCTLESETRSNNHVIKRVSKVHNFFFSYLRSHYGAVGTFSRLQTGLSKNGGFTPGRST